MAPPVQEAGAGPGDFAAFRLCEREGCEWQGSEKWIAQIAAILDKMPSVGQIRF